MTATKTVKERPILFSGEMVRAILDGRKTQTRRVIKPLPRIIEQGGELFVTIKNTCGGEWVCPYGKPGDRLWVRETWQRYGNGFAYRATPAFDDNGNWKPSIHMPRAASRITLEITNVRVERLQDISEEDAEAEGVESVDGGMAYLPSHQSWVNPMFSTQPGLLRGALANLTSLWDKINGKKHPWSSNPWVWVIEFKKI